MASEKRLIDANEFEKHFWQRGRDGEFRTLMDAELAIINASTVDAVEVVHGRWENITGGMITLGDCSECKVRQPVIGTNYCKNCGAKMDGDGNE